ncbi:hypothetical protein KR018_004226 [Drosophila ironensis]|nr:hypothetical protein KR018_004226 [Drosophila ironensis]
MAPKKHNAFIMFVNDWRDSHPECQRPSFAEAVTRCGPIWEKMDAQQRGPYHAGAKKANFRVRRKKELLNCNGQLLAHVQNKDLEEAELQLEMKRITERIVIDGIKSHDVESVKHLFVIFNFFTKAITSDVYVPAEFSACAYSLKNGITSVYSSFIDPGHIIFGQGSDAQHHSSTTHNLPLPPNAMGEKNMVKLYRDIVDFLIRNSHNGGDGPLVVFTKREDIPMVRSCFRYLSCEDQDYLQGDEVQIEVLDIQYLLFIMKKEVLRMTGLPDDHINMFITDVFFQRDFFEFVPKIACQFHEDNDRAKYCTQSQVTRWAYNFSDFLCADLAIEVLPGKHVPAKAKTNFRITGANDNANASAHNTSNDSFYSLPGSRVKGESFTSVCTDSRHSVARGSYIPSNHTMFSGDGSANHVGRGVSLGAWNIPAHARSLKDVRDDEFDISGTGKSKRH